MAVHSTLLWFSLLATSSAQNSGLGVERPSGFASSATSPAEIVHDVQLADADASIAFASQNSLRGVGQALRAARTNTEHHRIIQMPAREVGQEELLAEASEILFEAEGSTFDRLVMRRLMPSPGANRFRMLSTMIMFAAAAWPAVLKLKHLIGAYRQIVPRGKDRFEDPWWC